MKFDHIRNVFNFLIDKTIDQSKPFNLCIYSLRCKFSQTIDWFKIWGRNSTARVHMKKIQNRNEQTFTHKFITLRCILFHNQIFPLIRAQILIWYYKLSLRRVPIKFSWCEIPTLNRIRMYHFEFISIVNTSTTFFCVSVISIFSCHSFLGVYTV